MPIWLLSLSAHLRIPLLKKQICDIYSEKVIHSDDQWEPKQVDPTLIDYPTKGADGGYVTVIQPGKPEYQWSSATLNFQRPARENLIIYEVWVYDYTAKRTFKGLIDKLDYIQNLGVNAIELMPVTEFEGNQSWGYNPVLYFALDRTYGKADDFKQLVDECHKRGIAVIMDMVFNHTNGSNPMVKLYPWTSSSKTETELRLNPWININPPEGDNGYGEEWNHDFDHAHVLFRSEPNSNISKFINAYKSASSRLIKKEYPSIKSRLYKEAFWSQSFCLISTGEANIETIKKYIESQGE